MKMIRNICLVLCLLPVNVFGNEIMNVCRCDYGVLAIKYKNHSLLLGSDTAERSIGWHYTKCVCSKEYNHNGCGYWVSNCPPLWRINNTEKKRTPNLRKVWSIGPYPPTPFRPPPPCQALPDIPPSPYRRGRDFKEWRYAPAFARGEGFRNSKLNYSEIP